MHTGRTCGTTVATYGFSIRRSAGCCHFLTIWGCESTPSCPIQIDIRRLNIYIVQIQLTSFWEKIILWLNKGRNRLVCTQEGPVVPQSQLMVFQQEGSPFTRSSRRSQTAGLQCTRILNLGHFKIFLSDLICPILPLFKNQNTHFQDTYLISLVKANESIEITKHIIENKTGFFRRGYPV